MFLFINYEDLGKSTILSTENTWLLKYDFHIILSLYRMSVLLVVIAVTLVISAAAANAVLPAAFGHHPQRGVQALPTIFEDMEVTVRIDAAPYPLEVGNVDTVNLKIRFFDILTDSTVEKVTYRIEIWKAEQLLARNLFYDDDGILYIEVRPDGNCDVAEPSRCTSYGGLEHPYVPAALYVRGTECNDGNIDVCARPVITGPIFDRGGLYDIRIDVESATDPKILLPEILSYHTFVSVAQEHDFLVHTAHMGEVPVVIKTHYDDVGNFAFDSSDNSISFDMRFDWDPAYIDLVQLVHQEVRVPASFAPFVPGGDLTGYVNGVELDQRGLISDPYSIDNTNILHFLITDKTLKKINDSLGPDNHANKVMSLKVVPSPENKYISSDFYLVGLEGSERQVPTDVSVSYDGTYGADQDIPFEFAFFNEDGTPIPDIRYAYAAYDESGQELTRGGYDDTATPGIVAIEGVDVQDIYIPSKGPVRIDVLVYGVGPDYDQKYAGTGTTILDIGSDLTIHMHESVLIPRWVKDSSGWWAYSAADDVTFIQGIRLLIQNDIIKVPHTGVGITGQESGSGSDTVPRWVKIGAGWWADGAIDDATFIQSIQFLIRQGILIV